jgi:hypothetical protein
LNPSFVQCVCQAPSQSLAGGRTEQLTDDHEDLRRAATLKVFSQLVGAAFADA